ncbi:hypothetical protein Cch01nite_42790 [Cellulomonas chitinilytica]|uniref:Uncharacterized protein n=1 Tax=Cellulomonas chitinilytica TaxID=398759 RepID=A0A919U125_9CELL|nr:hypothetical protein [Cellulomonas chitinilytica]GIG23555.1 hypothetical protein Cch01nite_42790 [Cellulomonas chitinilytica]
MVMRRGLLAAGVAVLGVVGVAVPASAVAPLTSGIGPSPDTSQVFLFVGPSSVSGRYTVTVTGHIAGPLSVSTLVTFELFGDDPIYDDVLGVTGSGTTQNGSFHISTDVPRSAVNEDLIGSDEVYAHVTTLLGFSANTNVVSGSF